MGDDGGSLSQLTCPSRREFTTYCMADSRVLHLNEELVFTHLIEYNRRQLEWGIRRVDDERLGLDVGGGSHGWLCRLMGSGDIARRVDFNENT